MVKPLAARTVSSTVLPASPRLFHFLRPALLEPRRGGLSHRQARSFSSFYEACVEATAFAQSRNQNRPNPLRRRAEHQIPLSCPGCGALSQTVESEKAGFYNRTRTAVRRYLEHGAQEAQEEHAAFSEAVQSADKSILQQLGLDRASRYAALSSPSSVETPVCDRCHSLSHHHHGIPIHHPSVDALSATIAESPYRHNHVYHVLDAADFPMSLVPQLQRQLHFSRLRTQNRRSKSHRYTRGGVADMSFVITRSDLLAPKKEMVDRMMPYLTEVLRDALGKSGHNVRMGSLRCVSAKRGWWTKDVKGTIYRRGGASWMVGKVNVGKSSLFEAVFPKGQGGQVLDMDQLREDASQRAVVGPTDASASAALESSPTNTSVSDGPQHHNDFMDTSILLPPAPKEVLYPQMPLISAQPGTTASPIRLPFGNGKGELIDLPGIARHTLEDFVKPSDRRHLIMEHRVSPERISLKPQQSLLLDGLVRIVPSTPDLVFLTHSFVPLKTHRTATSKLAEMDAGQRLHPLHTSMIADQQRVDAAGGLKSAGVFQLKWDVTRLYSGPVTRKDAAGLKPETLPWIIYAADVLVEGCGWVEIHAQVRKRKWFGDAAEDRVEAGPAPAHGEPSDALSAVTAADEEKTQRWQSRREKYPEIEVFSPRGQFIGIRRPMTAFATGGSSFKMKGSARARPRRSMRAVRLQKASKQKEV